MSDFYHERRNRFFLLLELRDLGLDLGLDLFDSSRTTETVSLSVAISASPASFAGKGLVRRTKSATKNPFVWCSRGSVRTHMDAPLKTDSRPRPGNEGRAGTSSNMGHRCRTSDTTYAHSNKMLMNITRETLITSSFSFRLIEQVE